MTQEQSAEFVRTGGVRCPRCGSEDLEVTDRDFDVGEIVCHTSCENCGLEISETYTLTSVNEE